MEIYRKLPFAGLGNILFNLSFLPGNCRNISNTIYDNEFGSCIELDSKYFDVIQDFPEYKSFDKCQIIINLETIDHMYKILHQIIRPTIFMKQQIKENFHLIDGVTCGINIRRGSYSEDSKQYSDDRALSSEHMFCNDNGLEIFKKIISDSPGRVYVSSDSPSTKKELKNIFGDKVTMVETEFIHTSTDANHPANRTLKNYRDVYLVWFLLSMCPRIFITAGLTSEVRSTFGLTAALYGQIPFEEIMSR
jgi:hypothetical protein